MQGGLPVPSEWVRFWSGTHMLVPLKVWDLCSVCAHSPVRPSAQVAPGALWGRQRAGPQGRSGWGLWSPRSRLC